MSFEERPVSEEDTRDAYQRGHGNTRSIVRIVGPVVFWTINTVVVREPRVTATGNR